MVTDKRMAELSAMLALDLIKERDCTNTMRTIVTEICPFLITMNTPIPIARYQIIKEVPNAD